MNERLPIKSLQTSKEDLQEKMEKKFLQAFDMLGKATTIKDNHKVYDLLFDTMKIYKKLKEEK